MLKLFQMSKRMASIAEKSVIEFNIRENSITYTQIYSEIRFICESS